MKTRTCTKKSEEEWETASSSSDDIYSDDSMNNFILDMKPRRKRRAVPSHSHCENTRSIKGNIRPRSSTPFKLEGSCKRSLFSSTITAINMSKGKKKFPKSSAVARVKNAFASLRDLTSSSDASAESDIEETPSRSPNYRSLPTGSPKIKSEEEEQKKGMLKRVINELKQRKTGFVGNKKERKECSTHYVRQENKLKKFVSSAYGFTKAFDYAIICMRNGIKLPHASEMLSQLTSRHEGSSNSLNFEESRGECPIEIKELQCSDDLECKAELNDNAPLNASGLHDSINSVNLRRSNRKRKLAAQEVCIVQTTNIRLAKSLNSGLNSSAIEAADLKTSIDKVRKKNTQASPLSSLTPIATKSTPKKGDRTETKTNVTKSNDSGQTKNSDYRKSTGNISKNSKSKQIKKNVYKRNDSSQTKKNVSANDNRKKQKEGLICKQQSLSTNSDASKHTSPKDILNTFVKDASSNPNCRVRKQLQKSDISPRKRSPVKVKNGMNDSLVIEAFLSDDKSGNCSGFLKVKPGGERPPQRLEDPAVLYTVVKGKADVLVNNKSDILGEGRNIEIRKGQVFSIKNAYKRNILIMSFCKYS